MRTRKRTLERGAAALALATLGLAAGHAQAVEVWLRAAATTVSMPDPNGGAPIPVPMWGFAACGTNFSPCTDPVTVPGPALTVAPGDPQLVVHLRNDLAVPTSLVVNGLTKVMSPVWTDGTSGPRGTNLAKRVRSFDAEAAPAGGVQDYVWNNVAPGTYLYQSGTQPQVQVQMGLYGAVTKNAADVVTGPIPARGQAYAATATQVAANFEYDNQALLLYSEIDPALHAAVASGTYGAACPPATPDCGNPTSTFDYVPKYFLVNGQPYPLGTSVFAPAGNPGRTLLRFVNAGLTTHVPTIQGAHWTLIAEDGKAYPYQRAQYTALLPAAKTVDVLLTPDSGGGNYAIYDRRLSLSNAGISGGGLFTVLQFGGAGAVGGTPGDGNAVPTAVPDSYDATANVTLNVGAPEGVLANDTDDGLPLPLKALVATGTSTGGGAFTMNANGSFSYTPPATVPAYPYADTFTYQVTDGKAISTGTVTVNLTVPTAPALGVLDTFNRAPAPTLGANWAQAASTTQPADLAIQGDAARAATTALGGLAIWTGSLGPKQGAGVVDAAPLANVAVVLKATGGSIATGVPANFVRVRCELANGGEVVIATLMGGSNATVYVKQAAFANTGCNGNGSLSAVVDAKGLVTAFLNGLYVGGVQLPDVGAWKGGGNVGIQMQTQGATVDSFAGGTLVP